jgi:hypothetical protein
VVILDQPFNIQILYGDLVKFLNQLKARFVKEILALIGNFQMFLCQQADCLATIRARLFFLADFALLNLQLAFCFAKIARIFYTRACRKGGKVFQANIDATCLSRFRNEARLIFFHSEDDKPTVNLSLDGAGLDFAFDFTRQTQTNRANFRKLEFVAFQFESRLRISEGVVSGFLLESGKASFFVAFQASLKESIKSTTDPSQRVLKHLRMNHCNIFANEFDVRQLILLLLVVNRFSDDLIGINAFAQRGIVKFATTVKGVLELLSNAF